MSSDIQPGFIALHGNHTEDLAQAVIEWMHVHPLEPLEEEIILVQSSGVAEWFKMELARQTGICSAARVELPGRFLWRTYRQVLGPTEVPKESPLDKLPMTWRLMKVLKDCQLTESFSSIRSYLQSGEIKRLLQLSSELADLFDQYQNYRSDWLESWSSGDDVVRSQRDGQPVAIPAEQRWQAELWRALLAPLSQEQRSATRPGLHRKVLDQLRIGSDFSDKVARRVIVFGMSHLPGATLETLAALSGHCQVMLAIPNPCRHYWGDIMEGRELLKAQRRRQKLRPGESGAPPDFQDMHLHAHPLLAAWGRQGRDFIRQLDDYDDAPAAQQRFGMARIDFFDETVSTEQTPLLLRVQNSIRDLDPLDPHAVKMPIAPDDQSIAFHIAHSPVRELEILQDHLLALLTQDSLSPRDIVVMLPDVQSVAPAIRAVFGQYPRGDRRHIPFDIADLSARSSSPLLLALQWMLELPARRCGLSELVDLLAVPAVAARFGIRAESLPQLTQWMSGAGIRWGLNLEQRQQLGLAACGEQNSAWFGLQRMLLGFASGTLDGGNGWNDIEPYTEVGGLDAELAGALAHLLQVVLDWWSLSEHETTPNAWCHGARSMMASLFKPVDETDTKTLGALDAALSNWLTACAQAEFDDPLPFEALAYAWLEALDMPGLERRFQAGGVTFCTLMPMRAIPFQVVCLLGMNDGDYPRRSTRSDFDLMGLPGQFRPGDRAGQHDDRQLMLEALLSARRVLYVSWTGRSVRDNSEMPPSVLISQLRDYIRASAGEQALKQCTFEHPLQPFSRSYFESDSALFTYADDWRAMHDADLVQEVSEPLPGFQPDPSVAMTLQQMTRFFRNPVSAFFKERLGVAFREQVEEAADTEAFKFNPLETYGLISEQLAQWPVRQESADLHGLIDSGLSALQRSGVLPMGALGEVKQDELKGTLGAMADAWQHCAAEFAKLEPSIPVEYLQDGMVVRDRIDGLRSSSNGQMIWLDFDAGKLLEKEKTPRSYKLLGSWLRSLIASANGVEIGGRLVGLDGVVTILPISTDHAKEQLDVLFGIWREGLSDPLPLPLKTSLTLAKQIKTDKEQKYEETYEGGGDDFSNEMAEVTDMCLARLFPDFEALLLGKTLEDSRLYELASMIYVPMLAWIEQSVSAHPYE